MNSVSIKTGKFQYSAFKLCVLFLIVYTFQVVTDFNPGFRPGQPLWKLFASMFGHSGLSHLFNNIFFIALFGSIYERLTNSRFFYATFILAGLAGNAAAFIFFPNSFIIGASAGGMGLMAALATYKPHQIGLGLGVPLPMWAVLLSYIFIDLSGLTAVNQIANEAHLLGVVAGVLIGIRMRSDSKKSKSTGEELVMEDSWKTKIKEWEEKWMFNN